ncbi:MAG: hypothetical protein N2045_04055 [Fimbriimonadales bacterium]|jgi:uncharacterized protein (DUF697 family)|nr:hypothetical protein [Fimbriimonadales bacterium]GBC89676.1 hypothetical protein HRbin14_00402 [bacterium HR14]GIV12089.1 MAG: hypothetical protein KatS3mg021_0371 [Fimbriimonadales bacterium]CUU05089.1 Uncharacterized conserved protein, DUF697 family [Armatimonadetes bacterium GBS]CUU36336.1 Uncharacterized conserved protein, DUF697 family [Armatimonadetes bacterium GXS]
MAIRQKLSQLTHWWNIVKELSPRQVEQELLTPFRIALVGQPDRTEAVWRVLTEGASPTMLQTASEYVKRFTSPPNEEFDFVLACDVLEVPQDAVEAVVDHFHKHEFPLVALARVLPGTRTLVVNRIIEDVATLNAGLAMLSAVPSVFPLLGLLAPPAALADMVVLTKNQLMMVLRVAAAFGKAPDWKQRLPELSSVLGAAFGWRAVARQLVGLVPGGVGMVVKGMVAYAGTLTVGRAVAWFYATGQAPGKAERARLYQQAWEEAREKSKEWRQP